MVKIDTLHVNPEHDSIPHDTSTDQADCRCGPAVKREPRDDGSEGKVLIHNAFDGRR